MVAVCPAVTTADAGCEHGSSRRCPPSISMMSGDRPETWYRPGGSGTENVVPSSALTLSLSTSVLDTGDNALSAYAYTTASGQQF